jgi:hypothetical protein
MTKGDYFLATADGPSIPIYDPYNGPVSVASDRFIGVFGSYWWEHGRCG